MFWFLLVEYAVNTVGPIGPYRLLFVLGVGVSLVPVSLHGKGDEDQLSEEEWDEMSDGKT